MASIPTRDAKGKVTKVIADAYRERVKTTSFLRSFFPNKEYASLEVSVEVIRGTERIAIDVIRGEKGYANKFDKSTERLYIPAPYREYFTISALDGYDAIFGRSEYVSADAVAVFVEGAVDKLMELVAKIERRYEVQCSQVLHDGIVELTNGDNVDFKRKAISKVDRSGETWATGTNDPRKHLQEAGDFLRQYGKIQEGRLNVIMGGSAYNALINNATFSASADIKNMTFDQLREPQRMAVGQTLHGSVSAGSYICNIFTYPEIYEDASGVVQKYVDAKKIIVLPENPRFQFAFGGVAVVDGDGDNATAAVKRGAFHFGKYVDKRGGNIDYDVQSAGLAIPVAIDQIYTAQVLA